MGPQEADNISHMVAVLRQEGTRPLGTFPGSKVPAFDLRRTDLGEDESS